MSRATPLACLVTTSVLALGLAAPAQAASSIDYAALGDSYSSGVGASGQSGSCLRSNNAYGPLWAAQNSPASFQFLACTGATTDDVRSSQIPSLSSGADLVSITVGGNDVGFTSTLLTCWTSTDSGCVAKVNEAKAYAASTLGGKLDATYAAIKAKAPGAKVVVLSYPLIYATPATGCTLSTAKQAAINDGARTLDAKIQERAEAAGFVYSEVRDEFSGHEVCSSTPYLNGVTLIPATNSYHPNNNGYRYGYLPAFTGAAG
ncbi:SGNH family lipase [Actinoplanes sichuanensis]|uniref:SGNH/GDSL hydrolase family protein n=1 Tax=Actinoplanes sichuanensis TaxID=512349 RepID=A0ABW4A691_9ACTN|nr:SGNH/GDSL hydrolase family protein [Actinoplanes sichuanensis]BEL07900.1 SGNH family lipase [Actinoplanes sichuanensis]